MKEIHHQDIKDLNYPASVNSISSSDPVEAVQNMELVNAVEPVHNAQDLETTDNRSIDDGFTDIGLTDNDQIMQLPQIASLPLINQTPAEIPIISTQTAVSHPIIYHHHHPSSGDIQMIPMQLNPMQLNPLQHPQQIASAINGVSDGLVNDYNTYYHHHHHHHHVPYIDPFAPNPATYYNYASSPILAYDNLEGYNMSPRAINNMIMPAIGSPPPLSTSNNLNVHQFRNHHSCTYHVESSRFSPY